MKQLSQSTIDFIRTHSRDDIHLLALQASRYPDIDIPAAIVQIAGRQIAANKIPSWQKTEGLLYPQHLSMEQCSSEITANYKASLVGGETLTDLTGGFGIDCAFLSGGFHRVVYVEQQKELCEIAEHNFPLLKLNHISILNEDATIYLQSMEKVDWIFIDPARRNEHGGKTIAISDCIPNVSELEELLLTKANHVMIKLSPMLDLSLALQEMKHVQQVHIISVNNECKELLLIIGKEQVLQPIQIHCINFTSNNKQLFEFTREEEQRAECSYTHQIENYLYEPNASILKGGAFRYIASRYNIKKLHPNSHLYTSNQELKDFPGRIFQVTGECTFNKKELKETLGNIQKANITVRNFPATVAEIRKRIKLSDGGDTYLFATTLNDNRKVLIVCNKN